MDRGWSIPTSRSSIDLQFCLCSIKFTKKYKGKKNFFTLRFPVLSQYSSSIYQSFLPLLPRFFLTAFLTNYIWKISRLSNLNVLDSPFISRFRTNFCFFFFSCPYFYLSIEWILIRFSHYIFVSFVNIWKVKVFFTRDFYWLSRIPSVRQLHRRRSLRQFDVPQEFRKLSWLTNLNVGYYVRHCFPNSTRIFVFFLLTYLKNFISTIYANVLL